MVCTGNVCRSPYIERRLAHQVRGTGIEISSAGTAALVGWLMERESKRLLQKAGGNATGFVARQLTPQMVRDSDLVIVAAEKHRQEVVRMEPTALRFTFRLKDLSDLAKKLPRTVPVGPAAEADDEQNQSSVAHVVQAIQGQRKGGRHARTSRADDLVDPFGKSPRVFERMAADVDELLPPIVRVLRSARASTAARPAGGAR